MFWLKRLKAESDESSWALPYGDMMSLLLAVFVMIAAMSELRPGGRFNVVSDAVRSAFGFSPVAPADAGAGLTSQPRLTFFERLHKAGLRRLSASPTAAADRDLLAPCDVVTERDRVVIRIAGSASFGRFSARLEPAAQLLIPRIAEFLIRPEAPLEIRGHNGDGPLPDYAPFRDGLDLAYGRARAVADALIRAGVARNRLHLTAWDDNRPLAAVGSRAARGGANRRIEIIVHAVPAAHL